PSDADASRRRPRGRAPQRDLLAERADRDRRLLRAHTAGPRRALGSAGRARLAVRSARRARAACSRSPRNFPGVRDAAVLTFRLRAFVAFARGCSGPRGGGLALVIAAAARCANTSPAAHTRGEFYDDVVAPCFAAGSQGADRSAGLYVCRRSLG